MIPMAEITIKKLTCLRCNHEWIPNTDKLPKVCPKCHSPYWNTPRRMQKYLLKENPKGRAATKKTVPRSMFGVNPDLPSFSRQEDDFKV